MMAKTSTNTVKVAIEQVRETIENPLNYIAEEKVYENRIEKLLFKDDLKGEERYFMFIKIQIMLIIIMKS